MKAFRVSPSNISTLSILSILDRRVCLEAGGERMSEIRELVESVDADEGV